MSAPVLPELEGLPFDVPPALRVARIARRRIAALSPADRAAWAASLDEVERDELATSFDLLAEPHQIWRPSRFRYELDLSGRGGGKTWKGGHAIRVVAENPKWLAGGEIGIGGRTANDVNQTIVPAVMAAHPTHRRPRFYPSHRLIVWPNGVRARLFSGEEPRSWRGPNLGFMLADEVAHWRYFEEAMTTLDFALRKGIARFLGTSTPIPAPAFLRFFFQTDEHGTPLVDDEGKPIPKPSVRVSTASTDDNPYLGDEAKAALHARYDGTRLGAQELGGAILLESKGAPWRRNEIRRCRPEDLPRFAEVVVALDPAVSRDGKGSETGIVVGGVDDAGQIYVLADASGPYRPEDAAEVIVAVYHTHRADRLVYEQNNGGAWIENAIRLSSERGESMEIEAVRAVGNKLSRAIGVAGKWQRGEVFHVGVLPALEHQMLTFDPAIPESQQTLDRVDALSHLAAALTGDERGGLDLFGRGRNPRARR